MKLIKKYQHSGQFDLIPTNVFPNDETQEVGYTLDSYGQPVPTYMLPLSTIQNHQYSTPSSTMRTDNIGIYQGEYQTVPIYNDGTIRSALPQWIYDNVPISAEDVVFTIPYVGDALDAGVALQNLDKGNYGEAALGLGFLALPNIIEKPLRKLSKNLRTLFKKHNVQPEPSITLPVENPITPEIVPERGPEVAQPPQAAVPNTQVSQVSLPAPKQPLLLNPPKQVNINLSRTQERLINNAINKKALYSWDISTLQDIPAEYWKVNPDIMNVIFRNNPEVGKKLFMQIDGKLLPIAELMPNDTNIEWLLNNPTFVSALKDLLDNDYHFRYKAANYFDNILVFDGSKEAELYRALDRPGVKEIIPAAYKTLLLSFINHNNIPIKEIFEKFEQSGLYQLKEDYFVGDLKKRIETILKLKSNGATKDQLIDLDEFYKNGVIPLFDGYNAEVIPQLKSAKQLYILGNIDNTYADALLEKFGEQDLLNAGIVFSRREGKPVYSREAIDNLSIDQLKALKMHSHSGSGTASYDGLSEDVSKQLKTRFKLDLNQDPKAHKKIVERVHEILQSRLGSGNIYYSSASDLSVDSYPIALREYLESIAQGKARLLSPEELKAISRSKFISLNNYGVRNAYELVGANTLNFDLKNVDDLVVKPRLADENVVYDLVDTKGNVIRTYRRLSQQEQLDRINKIIHRLNKKYGASMPEAYIKNDYIYVPNLISISYKEGGKLANKIK